MWRIVETMEALKKISIDLINEWRPRRVYTLAASYPATAILSSVSLTTFIVIQANFLIRLLSCVIYYLDIVARELFRLLYPAALVALTVVWCIHITNFSVKACQFDRELDNQCHGYPVFNVILKVVLCIYISQLILFCLPSVVNFFAMPFASAPTLLFTIIFSVGVIGYGLYLVLRHTLPGVLWQERAGELVRNDNIDFDTVGDNNTCVVCLASPKTHLIKPCNHFCACGDCIRRLNECPLCKRPINMHERIYST